MHIDWERRRRNIRILMAAVGTNPTRLAKASNLSANTLSKFLNGGSKELTEASMMKVLPALGLHSSLDLDTDNILSDPLNEIKRHLSEIPDSELPGLLRELQARFPIDE